MNLTGNNNSGEKETGRLEAFSDGVFAIAITLLVLDIKVPKVADLPKDKTLTDALLEGWPVYLAYATSFLTILVMWINHHDILKLVKRVDTAFLLINGLLLMVVSFIPFPTSLLAEYIQEPQQNTAAVVYAGTNVVLALVFNLLWRYASFRHRLLMPTVEADEVESIKRQYRYGPLLYVICVIVAFFNGLISFLIILALGVFFAIPFSSFRTPPPPVAEGSLPPQD